MITVDQLNKAGIFSDNNGVTNITDVMKISSKSQIKDEDAPSGMSAFKTANTRQLWSANAVKNSSPDTF